MVTMLVLSWDSRGARPVEALAGGIDVAISIDVDGGGDDCDTRVSTGIGSTCTVNGPFTVKGHVDSYTGISGTGGFGGISFHFNHSAGLTLNNRSAQTELGPTVSPYWSACALRTESKPAGGYEAVCHTSGASSLPAVPLKVVEVDYSCTTAGSQMVTMVDATTFLYNSGHSPDNSDKEGDEVLTIICTAASVGGIAEAPEVASMPLAEPDPSGTNTGLLAGVAAAAAASVVMVSGAAWYARKRWLR
jgi:hypothetical protein